MMPDIEIIVEVPETTKTLRSKISQEKLKKMSIDEAIKYVLSENSSTKEDKEVREHLKRQMQAEKEYYWVYSHEEENHKPIKTNEKAEKYIQKNILSLTLQKIWRS